MTVENKHFWEYCSHCEADIVICGTCGNNCCNGGYGEVMGLEPGTTMTCPDCPSAYDLQKNGIQIMHSYLTFKATRKPRVVKSGLALELAVKEASLFYDHAKILSDHDLLVSGVCVVVMKDADAEQAVKTGRLPVDGIVYQCGGY